MGITGLGYVVLQTKAQSKEVFLGVSSVVKITTRFNFSLMFLVFKILRVRNSPWDFLGVNFWSRDFLGS